MRFHVVAHLLDERILVGGGEVAFLDVAGEDDRFVGQQKETAHDGFFVGRQRKPERAGRFACVQVRANFSQQMFLQQRVFVAALHVLGNFFPPFFDRFDVGQHQFGVDDFDVAHRINAAGDVHDVRVFKAAHDLHDGVHLADVAEKLVAQTFAVRRAFHEAGDVHKFNRRRNQCADAGDFGERFEARFRHGDDAEVRLDGAERVIFRLRLVRAGDGVEQGGFAHVGQTDDSGFEHSKLLPQTAEEN